MFALNFLPYGNASKSAMFMYVVFFSFFISCNFEFYLMNALVYVDIDQGIHKGQKDERKPLFSEE